MTDLQLSLFGIGGTLVVGLFAYNRWQEYKARKTVDTAFGDGDDDVLLKSDQTEVRQEPSLDEPADQQPTRQKKAEAVSASEVSAPVATDGDSDIPEDGNGDAEEIAAPAVQPAVKKDLPVDELIDCVVPLEFDHPVKGEKILQELHDLRYVGKKPVHFIGITADGDKDLISVAHAYTTVLAGIRTVSRSGPLNELEYSEFVMKLRAAADNLGAHPDVPDMSRVINNARELQQFVAEHDAQLSVNVITTGAPWALHTLLAALEKMGFDQRPDGRLMMPDGDGGSLFTLSLNTEVSDTQTVKLTLLLDVPCVTPARDAFGAMTACAKSLAARLNGVVVDDGHHRIPDTSLEEIAQQVQEFYAAMEEAQIPAGSPRALRLFS
ncbi:cell division protein ZipA C-terminal FtsZ-binding domain-containing protein [Undibacterium squillarum]|uniref:Cell division protein ZipA n=1 Tax=Undibacterium squillarum TaxID=1131567 RepID=A0ABQ2XQ41_9BURK|nr:cell division protein ZipA C-terminal FtsZ-binding domain-containing protein [Undibacterium squillarum]GGX28196.1 cell division protein ZipA [Undibacterium squillarum]